MLFSIQFWIERTPIIWENAYEEGGGLGNKNKAAMDQAVYSASSGSTFLWYSGLWEIEVFTLPPPACSPLMATLYPASPRQYPWTLNLSRLESEYNTSSVFQKLLNSFVLIISHSHPHFLGSSHFHVYFYTELTSCCLQGWKRMTVRAHSCI